MKNLAKTLFAMALALAAQQAICAVDAPANVLNAEDAALAFGDAGKAMEVAALSGEEMESTQGAYLSYGASIYLNSYSSLPRSTSGASSVGMYLINYSLSRFTPSYSSQIYNLAFSRVGGYYKSSGH